MIDMKVRTFAQILALSGAASGYGAALVDAAQANCRHVGGGVLISKQIRNRRIDMKRNGALWLALAIALIGLLSPALAQPTPSSAVACHFVIRAYLNIGANGQGVAEVAGYITDVPGISSDLLFNGSPHSESTAFLTFRSDLVTLTPLLPNGVINLEHVSAGTFNIYFNPHPDGNWSNPDTFSGDSSFPGNPVAHFMRRESLFYQTDTLARHDVTETLEASRSFVLKGHSYDLVDIVPGGFTLYETYSNTPPSGSGIAGFPVALPGAGNCAAVATTGEDQQ
jgi:hypothetical protein